MSQNKKKFQIKRRGTMDLSSVRNLDLSKIPDLNFEDKTTKSANLLKKLPNIKEDVISMEKYHAL